MAAIVLVGLILIWIVDVGLGIQTVCGLALAASIDIAFFVAGTPRLAGLFLALLVAILLFLLTGPALGLLAASWVDGLGFFLLGLVLGMMAFRDAEVKMGKGKNSRPFAPRDLNTNPRDEDAARIWFTNNLDRQQRQRPASWPGVARW